ncbi:MAG: glycine cleavage system regulatory protein [Myxococcota bacterium]|jgi:glycine cleavage system regulatory protein
MDTTLVLTVIGPDRPGLVDALSNVIVGHAGSWQKGRMTRLAGQFAGILEVAVARERVDSMVAALRALDGHGLRVDAQPTQPDHAGEPPPVTIIEIVGHDRTGIVAAISKTLAQHDVNVIELNSQVVQAPWSGEKMFEARIEVHAPASVSFDEIRVSLEALAGDLMVDLSIQGS